MLKRFTRVLPLLMAIFILFSLVQSEPVQAEEPVFDNQVLIIHFQNRDQLADLANRYDVVEVDHNTKTIKVFSNQITRDALQAEGVSWLVDQAYTSLINQAIKPLAGQTTGIPGYPCYRTIQEVYTSADQLAVTYPDLVEIRDIGDSWEKTQNASQGWDIRVMVLGNQTVTGIPKNDAFFMSGIHAREWAPVELNLRFAEYLLSNYETNADVKWLLDYNNIHLVLVTNPDGRTQDEANLQWLWRKNTNNNYCAGGTGSDGRGADLNRNWPFAWQAGGQQCSETYPGASQGSEPETQALLNYVRTLYPDMRGPNPTDPVNELTATGMFIDLHSYSRLVLWPWGYTYDNAPNNASLRVMSYKFAYYNGHTPQKSTELYPSAGTTDDWAYGELGLPGFCFEVGDSFHQSCSVFENDINPRNIQALIRAVKIARKPYKMTYAPEITQLTVEDETIDPGQNLVINYTVDDTRYSTYQGGVPSQNIDSIRWSIDTPSWIAGSNPKVVTLRKQVPVWTGELAISLSNLNLEPGQHVLYLEGWDGQGTGWGAPTAVFFTVNGGGTTTPEPTELPTPTPQPTPTLPYPTPTQIPVQEEIFLPLVFGNPTKQK